MSNGWTAIPHSEIKGRLVPSHPSWWAFIKFGQNLRWGDIHRMKIQDGLPMPTEDVTKKIKFFMEDA